MMPVARVALRLLAILIAVAALIDPVWTRSAPPSRELIAIDLTAGDADAVAAALASRATRWQIVPRRTTDSRLPCGRDERCVVIADGSMDVEVPADVSAPSMIAVRDAGAPNVAVRSAFAPSTQATAAGAIRVELSRTGSIAATTVRVLDGAAEVGAVTHRWAAGDEATVEVPWWPIAAGARMLRIEAVPIEGERTTIDNAIDAGVAVTEGASRVLVFDARPSWSSTFVRRALEDDPRFAVEYRARVAPALSAGTPAAALDPAGLEATNVVIIGGPDALTGADVSLLDRYVSRRGGSLILLAEQRPTGAVTRFFGGGWVEQLEAAAQAIGPLRAAEILHTDRVPIGATVLGRSGSAASIMAVPAGQGRVILSGAMDAWRHRDPAFDRFWRSVTAEAAAAGEALRIDVAAGLAASGSRVPFTLRYRSIDERSAIEARVSARCAGGAPAPVRVWPSGASGEFAGEIAVVEGGPCAIEATAGDRASTMVLAVAARPARGVDATLAKLEHSTRSLGGVVIGAGNESELARALDDSTEDSSRIVSVHPLRSPWWILPLAACLSIEWWLRRRTGLR